MSLVKPLIVAHRGLHTHCPENSLGAFMAAAEAGVPWVECDVWPSSDDAIVVIHDETLDRTTTGSGQVWRKPWEELRQLQLSTLPGDLDLLAGIFEKNAPGMLIEIKPPDAARFVRLVLNELSFYRFPCMVQSFHPENLYHAWAVDPKIDAAFLVQTRTELYAAAESGWPGIHAHHAAIDRAVVERLHDAGRQIGAWTVNEPADIRRMIDLGVDMLITDEPLLATQLLRDHPELPQRR